MGLVLKSRAQYADPRNGQMIPGPYAVIVKSEGNRRLRQQVVEVNVFRNKRAWDQGAQPLEVRVHGAEEADFDNFFSPEVLIAKGFDPYSAAEDFILQLPAVAAAVGVEDPSRSRLEWGDLWEKERE